MNRRTALRLLAYGRSRYTVADSEASSLTASMNKMPVIFLAHGSPMLLDSATLDRRTKALGGRDAAARVRSS